MPSELEKAEAALAKALAKYEPLQAALEAAQVTKEINAKADREAVLKAIALRDPARIQVMNCQDKVADLRAAAGLQPATIGKADR